MRPLSVLETVLYVDDLAAAEHFYREALGLVLDSRQEGRHVFFRCGEAMLLLFDPAATAAPGPVPSHGARGPGHVAFRVVDAELDGWRHELESRGVEIEAVVDWPQGGRSLYFRDPAGNSLELASPRIWGLGG